jgi:hypothetical protein
LPLVWSFVLGIQLYVQTDIKIQNDMKSKHKIIWSILSLLKCQVDINTWSSLTLDNKKRMEKNVQYIQVVYNINKGHVHILFIVKLLDAIFYTILYNI